MSLVYKLKNGSLLDEISGVQGTLTAGTSRGFVQTDKGLAMEFDGADTMIDHGDILDYTHTDVFSVAVAVKFTNGGIDMVICGRRKNASPWSGWMIYYGNGAGTVTFRFVDNAPTVRGSATTGVDDGQWHLLFCTADGATTKLYLDNVDVGDDDSTALSTLTNAASFRIGADNVNASNYNGLLTEPQVYDHVLTAKERGQLYTEFLQAGQTTTAIRGFSFPKDTDLSDEPDLVAAYNMTLVGNQVMDLSPNANHGTNSGAMPTEDGLAFDGVDDRVTSSLTQTAASPFSVCLRFKTSSDVTTEQTLWADYLGASDRSIIQIQSGTIRTVVYDGTEYKVSGTVIANTWYNVVLTWDGSSTIKLYLDAISQSGTTAVNHYASGGATILGGLTATTYNFNGIISDYKAYNRALTAQEAIDYHNSFNRPYIVENFDYGADGVTKLCENWIAGTGTYKNMELAIAEGELVTDGGFESGTTGFAVSDGTIAQSEEQVHNDTYSGKFTPNNVNDYIRPNGDIAIVTGKRYLIEGWIYIVSGNINFIQFSGSECLVYGGNAGNITTTGGWVKLSAYANALSTGNKSVFLLRQTSGTGVFYLDNISVTEIPPLPEFDHGKRYMQCVTAGTTSLPSNWANGEVSFYLKKGAEANLLWIAVTSNIIDRDSNNGYVLFLNSDESIYFNARTAGINTTLIRSAASYININTWYQIKIQRGSGVFKDIPTLQTSDMVNSGSLPYTSFTSNGRYGFSATSNGSSTQVAGTADEISIVNTEKYLVEFNLKLNSGTLPQYVFKQALPGGTISNTTTAVDGRNYGILTATATDTGVLQFQNSSTATDYTISNLTIRRIYDEGTFLTLIRGGAFGTGWTVVSVVGGSGSNPILDATYLTSNFLVADLDADDCIADAEFFTQFDV